MQSLETQTDSVRSVACRVKARRAKYINHILTNICFPTRTLWPPSGRRCPRSVFVKLGSRGREQTLWSDGSLPALTLSSQVGLGVDSVLVDGVDVVLGRLKGPQLGAQVAVLAAVGASGACGTGGRCESRGLVDAEGR